jgi:hypothetical protein
LLYRRTAVKHPTAEKTGQNGAIDDRAARRASAATLWRK